MWKFRFSQLWMLSLSISFGEIMTMKTYTGQWQTKWGSLPSRGTHWWNPLKSQGLYCALNSMSQNQLRLSPPLTHTCVRWFNFSNASQAASRWIDGSLRSRLTRTVPISCDNVAQNTYAAEIEARWFQVVSYLRISSVVKGRITCDFTALIILYLVHLPVRI